MQPRIAVSRKWHDEDVLLLTFQVSDGKSLFVCDAYANLDWGARAAEDLKIFSRQIHGGIYNLEAGDDGPEFAAGAFRARFHYFRPTELVIATTQQSNFFRFKNSDVASEAKMFLRTEPALLDRFVGSLPSVDSTGMEAVLECYSASDT